jgi:hypothetical protein
VYVSGKRVIRIRALTQDVTAVDIRFLTSYAPRVMLAAGAKTRAAARPVILAVGRNKAETAAEVLRAMAAVASSMHRESGIGNLA